MKKEKLKNSTNHVGACNARPSNNDLLERQKGITLVSLIITIIVMLILVAVTVNIALENGLFKAAQGAAKGTEAEKENETKLSSGNTTIIDENGNEKEVNINSFGQTGEISLPAELAVGDIIEYTPELSYTESEPYSVPAEYTGCTGTFYTDMETVQWKVLSIKGNTIRIIPNAVSTGTLTIEGANGWNNSIGALDNVCGAIYGNEASDKYTATAKSLTVTDINDITGYTVPSTTSYPASDYGTSNKFPIEYLKEKGVTEFTETEISNGYAENSEITVESTAYSYTAESQEGFDKEKFANWVNLGTNYWLASRCVYAYSGGAYFRVRYVVNSR